MRVSTNMLFQQGIDSMQRTQTQLARTQNQVASGTRVHTAADDPAGAAAALSLDQVLAGIAGYRSNIDAARHRLNLEESAIASGSDVLERVRELTIQANSGTQTLETRKLIGIELRQLREQLLSVANSGDGQGRYLFAGSADSASPFALLASGGAVYSGDQQQRLIAISNDRTIADGDAGSEVFMRLKSGNGVYAVSAAGTNTGTAALKQARVTDLSQWDSGSYQLSFSGGNYEVRDSANAIVASGTYTDGMPLAFRGIEVSFSGTPADGDSFTVARSSTQDMFAMLDKLIMLVEAPGVSAAERAQVQTGLHQVLGELDGVDAHLVEVRASIGSRLAALDDAEVRLQSQDVQTQETLSGLRDLDYAEAIARLNLQLTALQAAQQSFLRVQGLSLFDYLS